MEGEGDGGKHFEGIVRGERRGKGREKMSVRRSKGKDGRKWKGEEEGGDWSERMVRKEKR